MIIDDVIIDSCMQWARLQAPLDYNASHVNVGTSDEMLQRRRVRLEISIDDLAITGTNPVVIRQRTMCRVYLAEPRCKGFTENGTTRHDCPECGQLAETRIA